MAYSEPVVYKRFKAKEFFEKVMERMPVEVALSEDGDTQRWSVIAYEPDVELDVNKYQITLSTKDFVLEAHISHSTTFGFIELRDKFSNVYYRLKGLTGYWVNVKNGRYVIDLFIRLYPVNEARECPP